ncbi:MAG TPA: peptide chain release factor N(5)-glutamine methyltransferase [Elusimicrobia bacterium]|jgi:release factor glutamine methyltransferase|nr:peptide chain release factor N(5)-glutamine methyltransferase [Elusimicrobiota bacterium]
MKTNYTLKLLLKEINSELGKANISERRIESELFLAHLYGCTRPELYLRLSEQVSQEKIIFCQEFVKQRKKGVPLPYFLGETEFMGLKFFLQPGVFIPRQETEILVEETIKIAYQLMNLPAPYRAEGSCAGSTCPLNILDLGTGSGNIAVSLAKYLSRVKIIATDISENALKIAQKNAQLHNVERQITFFQGNLFELLTTDYSLPTTYYDIIVSNPPYITEKDSPDLEKELSYEPEIALFAKDDGLEYFQRIIPQANKFLKPEGYLLVEIGYGQKEKVENIFFSSGFKKIKTVKDYSNIERIIIGGDCTT